MSLRSWLRAAATKSGKESVRQPIRKKGPALRLLLERLEDRCTPADLFLTAAEVHSLADAAIARWVAAGISPEQVAVLENLQYEVAELGEHNLGQFRPGIITLDDNAAGNLWFVDATPGLEEEFTGTAPTFVAAPGTLAAGKIDLLTVLIHEQGHSLGLEGQVGAAADGNVMDETLQAGVRRLPLEGQAEDAVAGSLTRVQYLTSNATGGGTAHSTVQPSLVLNYVIALQGLFPSQNLSSEPFLGSVEMFAGNFAPRGWALAQGQLLSIAQNQSLFSILGITYGGDGTTNFALPDLRGRVPIGAGQGPGLANYVLGQTGGAENVTLTTSNLANHTHTVSGGPATSATGGGTSFENRQPYLVLNPIVNLVGLFPSRNFSSEELLGSVNWFAGNFAPAGYAFADGRLLSVDQHTALFSILGTTYGGDGLSTFGLPDLRGRMAVGVGPGLQTISLGQMGGTETIASTVSILPSHTHGIPGSPNPTGATGGGQAFDNRQPFLGLNYDISLVGIYPSSNLNSGEPGADPGLDPAVGQGFISGDQVLDEAEARLLIEPLLQAAIAYWQAAGIDDAQTALLQGLRLEFADLSPGRLASAGVDVITLDRDASNRGWFLDPTPDDAVEFGLIDPRSGAWVADEGSAAGHYDLLTALLHEMGHLLGLDHTQVPGQIMYGGLSVGSRILPEAADLVSAGEPEPAEEDFLAGASEPFIAGVGMFAGNFAPVGWAETNGQLLNISENDALFSLIGTTYGGDGQTTFALPDTRGRAVMGTGAGPGLTNRNLGEKVGTDFTTLTVAQIPSHTHEVTVPNSPPTIAGTVADQEINDQQTINPFSGVTLGDVDSPAQTQTVTVTLDVAAKGVFTAASLSASGFTDQDDGIYTFTGTAAQATTAIRQLIFDPTENRVPPGSTETTTFTITIDDGVVASPVTDATTTVVTTSVNDAPTIAGTVADQEINDKQTVNPFSGVTLGDVDSPAQTQTVTVTLDVAAKGVFTAASLTASGFTDQTGGVYSFTGTAAEATTAIRQLVFDPTENRVPPGSTETTTFTITIDDSVVATPVSDATTTVVTTSVNDAPTIAGTVADQEINDKQTVAPFSGVTLSDLDTPAQTQTVTVTLDVAAKGVFTAASLSASGFTDQTGGVYSFTGTASQATTAIRQLVFDPTENRVAPGSTETTTFTITINDGLAAPVSNNTTTVVSTSVADAPTLTVANPTVAVDEGTLAANSGTFGSPDAGASVVLTASVGAITQNDGAGTWSWTFTPTDETATQTVTITATDNLGATTSVQFALNVRNVFSFLTTTFGGTLRNDNDGDGRVDAGDALTYGIVVTNTGPDVATNVTVTPLLAPNVQRIAGTAKLFTDAASPVFQTLDRVFSRVGAYRNGNWYFDNNGSGMYDGGDGSTTFGGDAADRPVVGDWNGDGIDDVGVFRNGTWYLDRNGDGIFGPDDATALFGQAGDVPVVGDWNGDGIDDLGVWRNGSWYLDTNPDRQYGAGDRTATYGLNSDRPVVGDWDGNGSDDIGVFRNGLWYLDSNHSFAYDGGDASAQFGQGSNPVTGAAGDVPAPGDWNGDGKDEVGVWRQGTWYHDSNASGTYDAGDESATFGAATDVPVDGKWSGGTQPLGAINVGNLQPGQSARVEFRARVLPTTPAGTLLTNQTLVNGTDGGTALPYGTTMSQLTQVVGQAPTLPTGPAALLAGKTAPHATAAGTELAKIFFSNAGGTTSAPGAVTIQLPPGVNLDLPGSAPGWTQTAPGTFRLAVGRLAPHQIGYADVLLTFDPLNPPALPVNLLVAIA